MAFRRVLFRSKKLFFFFSQVEVTAEVREYLRKPTFDNWQWDDPEMLILLRQMYIDLKLVSKLNIEVIFFILIKFANTLLCLGSYCNIGSSLFSLNTK